MFNCTSKYGIMELAALKVFSIHIFSYCKVRKSFLELLETLTINT